MARRDDDADKNAGEGTGDFRITFGGLTIENADGEVTHINPHAQFGGVKAETLAKLEKWLMQNEALLKHHAEHGVLLNTELLKFNELRHD